MVAGLAIGMMVYWQALAPRLSNRPRKWRTRNVERRMGRTAGLRNLVGPALVAAALAACDRPAAKTARNSAPAQGDGDLPASVEALPAGATQPQTSPADTQPANAFLTVDGKVVEFPPARLRLTPTDED